MIDEALHDEVPGDAFTAEVEKLLTRSRTRFGSVRFRDAVTDLERPVELHTDDVAMALLLVDAYAFARSPEELAEFPRDAERALAVLDQAVAATDGGHDNLVLRLKRASVQTTLAFSDKSGGQMREVLKENRTLLAEAKDSGLEPIVQMELARRCIFSGLPDEALKLYARLSKNQGWNSLVLSETGLAHAAGGDGSKAIRVFEKAIASTTPATMEALNAAYREAPGERYWSFWTALETLPVRQCQNHAWLAGLRTLGYRVIQMTGLRVRSTTGLDRSRDSGRPRAHHRRQADEPLCRLVCQQLPAWQHFYLVHAGAGKGRAGAADHDDRRPEQDPPHIPGSRTRNALPKLKGQQARRLQVDYKQYLGRSRHVLRRWMDQEDMTMGLRA